MKPSFLPVPSTARQGAGLGDAELLRLLCQGRSIGHELLMRRYNRLLFRAARSIVPDDEQAVEAVIAAYLRAFCELDALPKDGALSTCLLRIVIQEARQQQRRRCQALRKGEHPQRCSQPDTV
jgi:RNA polymerase sigma-70 factor (ECF subfamily)